MFAIGGQSYYYIVHCKHEWYASRVQPQLTLPNSIQGPQTEGFSGGAHATQSKALALCRDASTQLSALGKSVPGL